MRIGQYNRLRVLRVSAGDLVLDTGDGGSLVLPASEIPEHSKSVAPADSVASPSTAGSTEQWLDVFVYSDPGGNPIVTTRTPLLTVGNAAMLRVVSRTPAGTWLDWGMPQDLLLPLSEQSRTSATDQHGRIFVYLFLDADSGRLCATTRLHRHLEEDGTELRPWQEVQLVIAEVTELGFKAIIDGRYLGLLYADGIFKPLKTGDRVTGYVKTIRADGKIDLTLYARASELKDELGQRILEDLKAMGGESTLTDKSPPEAIYQRYQVSKKNYKRALGNLYKAKAIRIQANRITLADNQS